MGKEHITKINQIWFRKNASILLTVFISIVLFILLSIYYFRDTVECYNTISQLNKTDNTEVVFSNNNTDKDCFANFNGSLFITSNYKAINADIFMVLPNVSYRDNLIGFTDPISDNACLISENLLLDYSLEVGGNIKVYNSTKTYVITGTLPPQKGIDDKYKHEGIIILSTNEDMLFSKEHDFITFYNSIDEYHNLNRRIILNGIYTYNKNIFLKQIVEQCVIINIMVIALEMVLGKNTRKKYSRKAYDGVKLQALWENIYLDMTVKYILPLLCVSIFFYLTLLPYKNAILIPFLLIFIYNNILIFLFSLFYYWRFTKCKLIRK